MRRVLLDHCVPRRVRQALVGCDTATAFQRGWAVLKNGALLQAAEDAGFDVLVTADKNLRYQQPLAHRRIAIVELPTNALPALLPHFTAIAEAVNRIQPGGYVELSFAP
jgi:alkanesulfonate monooxygenase SsuD/methylene tetrahydromethanopterin reductase-like flavin-dependent oxidoreductase (luciferase family)